MNVYCLRPAQRFIFNKAHILIIKNEGEQLILLENSFATASCDYFMKSENSSYYFYPPLFPQSKANVAGVVWPS